MKEHKEEITSSLNLKNQISKPVLSLAQRPEKHSYRFENNDGDVASKKKHVLENPNDPLPAIDPPGWVHERKYMQQNYDEKLNMFLEEREQSVKWLQSITNPKWDNVYNHPKFGEMTAKIFLCNWLAHDYLHFRQILYLKFDYLKLQTNENLNYAGKW